MPFDESASHRAFPLPGSRDHYGPDKVVDVEHIDLQLRPHLSERRLEGVCTTRVRTFDEPVQRIQMDAVDLQIQSVLCNGGPANFRADGRHLHVWFEPPLAAESQAELRVEYVAKNPRHGLFFIDPDAAYPDVVSHAWTQSQDENARYWFPCFDYPQEKQTTSATIFVPRGTFALSNGELVERRDEGDISLFRYEQHVPHSTYLVTLVVGPFVEVCQRQDPKPVFYYVLPGREDDGERAFGNTPKMIDVFEERLAAPYPYARYSQVAVSEFIFGGMENTTATTQTDRTLHDACAHLDFSSDPLVSHELAHQWFGDLLTCRDWSHAWLNEGFATFFEAVFAEAHLGYDEYLYDVFGFVVRYLEEDAERYRRPIVCNRYRDPIELFDRHLYEKGGAVLHMLRGELGEGRFWRAIRRYVRENAGRSVETIDLIRAIEGATGRNLRGFFDQWIFRGGHPELEYALSYDAHARTASVTIEQKQRLADNAPPYRFEVELGFVRDLPAGAQRNFGAGPMDGEQRLRVRVERARETFTVPLDFEPALVRVDPGAFLLGAISYRFGTTYASATLSSDPNPIARIYALRELAKDGSAAARAAIAQAFERETFWGVLAEAASAVAETRAPWARTLLLGAIAHPHAKVRRAVAGALGTFRSEDVATALLAPACDDVSYFVRAAALAALGRTRDARAFDVLTSALRQRSWNGTVEAGAARGLAELGDERATEPLLEASQLGHDEGLRRAVPDPLVRQAQLVDGARAAVVDRLDALLDDPMFLVRAAAIGAAQRLEDARLLPSLDRVAQSATDGRLRRDASEAAARIREAQRVPSQVEHLREDVEKLREEYRALQEKLETLSRT